MNIQIIFGVWEFSKYEYEYYYSGLIIRIIRIFVATLNLKHWIKIIFNLIPKSSKTELWSWLRMTWEHLCDQTWNCWSFGKYFCPLLADTIAWNPKKNQINKSYIRSKILIDVLGHMEKHLHYHVRFNVSLPPQSSISRKGLQLYYKKLELNYYHIPEPLELMSLLE